MMVLPGSINPRLPKITLSSVLSPSTPSLLLKTDESGRLSKSRKNVLNSISIVAAKSLTNMRNTVGIIGGMSFDSTFKFLMKLDEEDCVPFVVCSDSMLKKELVMYERALDGKERSRLDLQIVVENFRKKRLFLEGCGARCIVIPCNVCHSLYEEVSEECSVSFFHMGKCVARELKEAGLRPLEAGSTLRIGVLSVTPTLAATVYQNELIKQGFDVVLSDKATIEHTVIPAIKAIDRKDMEGAQNLLRVVLHFLFVWAVNVVVIASDELWDILPREDPLLKRCIDPIAVLANWTIRWAKDHKIS